MSLAIPCDQDLAEILSARAQDNLTPLAQGACWTQKTGAPLRPLPLLTSQLNLFARLGVILPMLYLFIPEPVVLFGPAFVHITTFHPFQGPLGTYGANINMAQ